MMSLPGAEREPQVRRGIKPDSRINNHGLSLRIPTIEQMRKEAGVSRGSLKYEVHAADLSILKGRCRFFV
jgi:hypothetical protein